MSKISDADLQRKESIERLQGEKIEVRERVDELNRLLEKQMEKIHILDDEIATLQALTSDIT